jgi:DNA polymerase alpha subunit A
MRRSRRGSTSEKAASLADLALLKKSGLTSRTASYQVTEQDAVYDEVDDATYAEHAARLRADARNFVVRESSRDKDDDDVGMDDINGGEDGDDHRRRHSHRGHPDDEDADEFAEEDELSIFHSDCAEPAGSRGQGRKRRRNASGPRRAMHPPAQPRRVSAAFLGTRWQSRAQPHQSEDADPSHLDGDDPQRQVDSSTAPQAALAFDASLLDLKHQETLNKKRAARGRAKKLATRAEPIVGDIFLDDSNARIDQVNRTTIHAANHFADMAHKDPDIHSSPSFPDDPAVRSAGTDVELQGSTALAHNPNLDAGPAGPPLATSAFGTETSYVPLVSTALNARKLPATSAPSGLQSSNGAIAGLPIRTECARPGAPLALEPNGDLLLFWTDAHEVRVNGGEHLYLFGKAAVDSLDSGVYVSVCIQVLGLDRALYVLPRDRLRGSDGQETSQPVDILKDVHAEISRKLLSSSGTSNGPAAFKAKVVTRACPFGDCDAPRDPTDYLKVRFPFDKANTLTADASGNSFKRVYGVKTTASETLCLKCGLKGPSWLRISGSSALAARVSHARHTLVVPSPDCIAVAVDLCDRAPPAMSALCISTKSALNPRSGANEIVMLSGVFIPQVPLDVALDPACVDSGREFVIMCTPDSRAMPFGFADQRMVRTSGTHEIVGNESALLSNFLSKLLRLDPDALVGHDMLGFGLDLLLARMAARRTRTWSCIGRLVQRRDLTSMVKNNSITSWFKAEAVAGRLVVDTYASAKEIRKEKDYSLAALSVSILGVKGPGDLRFLGPATNSDAVASAYEATETLCRLVAECSAESRTTGRLAARLSVLPLSKQLTCISGNLWSRTLQGARAQRIEALLTHEYHLIGSKKAGALASAGNVQAKLLLPDKLTKAERHSISALSNPNELPAPTSKKATSTRRKAQYAGGLVLEPKKGFYDRYCLQLDFNSLYPSIIQEFNICFTTIALGSSADDDINQLLPEKSIGEGVLPRVLSRLVSERRQVKAQLARESDPTLRNQLDIRQTAIKLTANSLYGCLGFENSRFYAQPLAALVTMQGRDTLQRTVDLARDAFNAQVIYGDTDSLFVYTGLDDINMVRELGAKLKFEINRRYKTLSIEIDAIYAKMLLCKKKTYAALSVNPMRPGLQLEVKGLALVRHDWCDLSHQASENFLAEIFKDNRPGNYPMADGKDRILGPALASMDEALGNVLVFLEDLAAKVRGNQVELNKFVVTKSLTKDPAQYPDANSLPHVQVAIRLRKSGRRVGAGDYIKYVICKESQGSHAGSGTSNRSSGLASRAFHPDEVIASKGALVLDSEYYLENQVLPPIMRLCEPIESIEGSRLATALGLDSQKYARHEVSERREHGLTGFSDVQPLLITCPGCRSESEFKGVVYAGKAVKSNGLECIHCNRRLSIAAISNSIVLQNRKWVKQYYTTPFKLNGGDGIWARRETRNVGLGGHAAQISRQFDEAWLYKQLRYVRYLMDVDSLWARVEDGDSESKIASNMGGSLAKKGWVARERNPLLLHDAAAYDEFLGLANAALEMNAYRLVDLSVFLAPLGL